MRQSLFSTTIEKNNLIQTKRNSVILDEKNIPPKEAPVGTRLVDAGIITRDQLRIALYEQKQSGEMLGAVLVRLGFLDESVLASVLAARSGFEQINLKGFSPSTFLLQLMPRSLAEKCRAVPLELDGETLKIAMADPYDLAAMDTLRRCLPKDFVILPLIASSAEITAAIDRFYGQKNSFDGILCELESGLIPQSFEESDYSHPVIRLVDMILSEAVNSGASDIHLEPENSFVRLRYRIDGRLQQVRVFHIAHWPAVSHRLKIMAGMNIADKRSIQDGRFQRRFGDREIDFRVAAMPTVWGEIIVVRILDRRRALLSLDELGFSESCLSDLRLAMQRPEGIFLVTGPTGSGKTTTLYSILRRISAEDVSISTLEEPVEYQLGLIRQTSVNEAQGLTFAAGVRGVLRMDPDIIFIGEVRDGETAQMALRAAMTGHQIYSTLHCNDSASAVPRLVDLGASRHLIAGNLACVIAQRLVRRLCPHCKKPRKATPEECEVLNIDSLSAPELFEAEGCDSCSYAGTIGRTAIAEVLRITPEIDEMIASGAASAAIIRQARTSGFRSMREDGTARVLAGEISLADLRRSVDLTRRI